MGSPAKFSPRQDSEIPGSEESRTGEGRVSLCSVDGEKTEAPPLDSPVQISDAQLVTQCLSGHEDGWRTFVDRFRTPVWHIAFRFAATPDDADELTQDVFVRLVNVLPSYRPSGALGAWVRQVATNVAIDAYRRRRRTPLLVSDEEMPEAPVPTAWQPDAIAERREEAARIRALVDRMPPELSEPLILRDLMDCDYPEIAERLDIPLGTVKSRIHRARQTLARARRTLGRGGSVRIGGGGGR
ncbi:MAG: RNA polymerase sigma factor [Acidobacteria bacterium]|nr:RNA polymerase sigma factor [Acidobacteriota bacterium]MYA46557.1 RNA polymerase sigma factor [Acidobacteriota bacterium]MYH21012.1 RNA polymerase sigma factor [Acidobacteriota bacterium]MYI39867.1 RNA polymerase sigma factor [Acidobacteriota bacterium]MYK80081.1 RNA polymerase sigma factor [Acidobacteriota bacterium]